MKSKTDNPKILLDQMKKKSRKNWKKVDKLFKKNLIQNETIEFPEFPKLKRQTFKID